MIKLDQKKHSFIRNISRSGNSYVVTIPMYFFKAGLINPNKKHHFTLKEVKHNVSV